MCYEYETTSAASNEITLYGISTLYVDEEFLVNYSNTCSCRGGGKGQLPLKTQGPGAGAWAELQG